MAAAAADVEWKWWWILVIWKLGVSTDFGGGRRCGVVVMVAWCEGGVKD